MTKRRVVIGVSRLSENYANWLNRLHSGLEILDFYTLEAVDVAAGFQSIHGLLLTGGGDIDPALYGRQEDLVYCNGLDARRDRLEYGLIGLAFEFSIPILGICRGQQILNVFKKGSLYADIPTFVKNHIMHAGEQGDVHHAISIDRSSMLYSLTRTNGDTVNSSHHQAVNMIGEGFRASAFSSDGIIEAIEHTSADKSFCVAVQWHPERMEFENPLSRLVGKGFIEAVIESAGS